MVITLPFTICVKAIGNKKDSIHCGKYDFFSFKDTDDLQDSRGKEGTICYSTLPLPPAHEHSDSYLQLCM